MSETDQAASLETRTKELEEALAEARDIIVSRDDLSDQEKDWCEWTRRLLQKKG